MTLDFSKKDNNKIIKSWIFYDWANSAFATTIMATVLPIFYTDIAGSALSKAKATSYWGYTQSIAMLIVALMVPVLGAISDFSHLKMRFLKIFAYTGILATASLITVDSGDYILCSLLFIFASIGFSGGNVFYDSILPEISTSENIDTISSKGFAMGYLGGGLLLMINLFIIQFPKLFFFKNTVIATRFTFLTVAVWWFVFSLPLFKSVRDIKQKVSKDSYVLIGFKRIYNTFKEIKKYKQLFKFILAFWLYNDGIGTIIRMATIYGREVGIGKLHLIGALLLTQFVGIPFSLLFGKIAKRVGTKKSIYIAISIYILITTWGFFLNSAFDFWVLAFLVGTVQGGSQALSRSLYASMVPKKKSSEFFGFLAISSKFAAVFGPFVFALIAQLTGSSRFGIISLIAFFILGLILLSTVNVNEGRKIANN
ncbi:MAG: MFS transporter [Firmicutes bacterium]|nr:MFS transporter [Bacillota bacterium]